MAVSKFSMRKVSGRCIVGALMLGAVAGCDDSPGEPRSDSPVRLSFAMQPEAVQEGQLAFAPVQVAVLDARGNVATGSRATVTISLAANPSGDTLGGTTSIAAVNGVATFPDLSMSLPAENVTLEASSGTLQRASSAPFDVRLSFVQVSAGYAHTCGVTVANAAYCWGFNGNGRLGDGTTTPRLSPTPVAGAHRFTHVSASRFRSCAVTTANAVYCWGENSFGAVGDGTTTDRLTPALVIGGQSFTRVSSSREHTCALAITGVVYCWGYNGMGHLGDGTNAHRLTPGAVAGQLMFAQLSGSCAITTTGAAYCWGWNHAGQVGDGTTTQRLEPTAVVGGLRFRQISASEAYTCGVTTDDAGYCWGEAGWPDGGSFSRSTPTAIPGGLAFAGVSAGLAVGCGVTTSKRAYCWGNGNLNGQLGDGTTQAHASPAPVVGGLSFVQVSILGPHACGVTDTRVAYCWGLGDFGRLGTGTTSDSPIPVRVRH